MAIYEYDFFFSFMICTFTVASKNGHLDIGDCLCLCCLITHGLSKDIAVSSYMNHFSKTCKSPDQTSGHT